MGTVEALKDKVQLLGERLMYYQHANQDLQRQLSELTAEREALLGKVGDLEKKTVNLQLSRSLPTEDADSEALNLRLDAFIREIDECIKRLKS